MLSEPTRAASCARDAGHRYLQANRDPGRGGNDLTRQPATGFFFGGRKQRTWPSKGQVLCQPGGNGHRTSYSRLITLDVARVVVVKEVSLLRPREEWAASFN